MLTLARSRSLCFAWQAAFAEVPVAREFHVGKEAAILGVSLFVLGLGLGPLVAGPMSEIYGRNVVYRFSLALFFAFMFPVAFAPDIGKWLDGLSSLRVLLQLIVAMLAGSRVPRFPLYVWVLRGRVSQRGRRKRQRYVLQ
jgi:MFS family permease